MGYAALIIGFLLLATLCLLNINAVIAHIPKHLLFSFQLFLILG